MDWKFWQKDQEKDQLLLINKDLQKKTSQLIRDNQKLNVVLTGLMGYESEVYTGETTPNELGVTKM